METINLMELSLALAGGMPLGQEEIDFDVWIALGELKRRNDAVLALQGMMH